MKIVTLERSSVGMDCDTSRWQELGEVVEYRVTPYEEISERVADADVIVANKCRLNEETLRLATHVKMIAEMATGYDNINLDYCREKNIAVANVSGYSTDAVVQHTFALAFYVMEHLSYYDRYVKSGAYAAQDEFAHYAKHFHELSQKTWGIVGTGNIGQGVAKVAAAFGCRVLFYSASGKYTVDGYEMTDLETILKESDILSLHCPLTEKTKYLINSGSLRKMKKTAYLINVARGAVVNNSDLAQALREGVIAGAGLDVLEQEPISGDNPLAKIMDSERLIITPHMAWGAVEARQRCADEVYENIRAFMNGESRNRIV